MVGDHAGYRWPVTPAPAFVGRERELATLIEVLSRPPAVVLVEAEPGAGKTRLVREFLASREGRRHRMLMAVCPPFREVLTLGPIVDAVRQAEPAGLRSGRPRLSPLSGALRPLLPEWAGTLPPAPEPLPDPTAARHRLFRALAELLGALRVSGLVVEDVHWADPMTLEFLLYLTRGAAGAPPPEAGAPSLVVTYRPTDVPPDSLLLRLSSRAPAGVTPVRITLPPLDVAGTTALAASILEGVPPPPDAADLLHARTGGLPLAVEELARRLRDLTDRPARTGDWVRRGLAGLSVSPTLRDTVLERVRRLSEPAQRVLRLCAVIAEPVAVATVAGASGSAGQGAPGGAAGQAPGGAGGPADQDALSEAVGSGLMCEHEQGRIGYRHAFMGQVVYEELGPAQRRSLHGQAAAALAAAPDAAALTVQLVRHFREAGEVAQWARYAEQAAARAVASGDRTSAAALLVDLVAEPGVPDATRLWLARQLGEAALRRRERVDALHHRVVDALRTTLATDACDEADLAPVRSAYGRLLSQRGDLAEAQAELARAVPHLEPRSLEAARVMTYLGWPSIGPWPAAVHRRWLRRAAAVDARGFSAHERLILTADRAIALAQLGEEEGWALIAALPATAPRPEGRQLLARTYLNAGVAAVIWGRYREAERHYATAETLAETENLTRLQERLAVARVELAWYTGAWEGLADRVTALVDAEESEQLVRLAARSVAGRYHTMTGAHRRAAECLTAALTHAQQLGPAELLEPASALARLRLAQDRPAEARQLTEKPIEPVAGKGLWVWATDVATTRMEALVATGRIDQAAALVNGYERGLRGRDAPGPRAGLASCRALLARARGEPAAARFARAAAAWERLPRPYDSLLWRERQADCLLAEGSGEQGRELLAEVWRRLWELGARHDAERVSRRLRALGVDARRPWRGGRRGYGSLPSPREREVIRLLLAGKTNREIAEELYKSPRTVAGQVASVMRKLGVSSRTELAVRVVEAGLLDRRPGG